ncbi:hypothetical protein QJS04_geneDACA014160 [Acorus gramineus]|uniref:Uncharacterized protein n=1 Tax=Acorus gramineus TaxID=55184 RepID=A0AAV9B3D7_ACOGR|nr:hypothetical protein QJS04_geneDACA014160 [Acorus gramineus]
MKDNIVHTIHDKHNLICLSVSMGTVYPRRFYQFVERDSVPMPPTLTKCLARLGSEFEQMERGS